MELKTLDDVVKFVTGRLERGESANHDFSENEAKTLLLAVAQSFQAPDLNMTIKPNSTFRLANGEAKGELKLDADGSGLTFKYTLKNTSSGIAFTQKGAKVDNVFKRAGAGLKGINPQQLVDQALQKPVDLLLQEQLQAQINRATPWIEVNGVQFHFTPNDRLSVTVKGHNKNRGEFIPPPF